MSSISAIHNNAIMIDDVSYANAAMKNQSISQSRTIIAHWDFCYLKTHQNYNINFVFEKIATIVVAVATFVVDQIATIVVAVATIVNIATIVITSGHPRNLMTREWLITYNI